MVAIERFSHYFNDLVRSMDYPFISKYWPGEWKIKFVNKQYNEHGFEYVDIGEPIIHDFEYKVEAKDLPLNKIAEYFHSNIDSKSWMKCGKNLELIKSDSLIVSDGIIFTISGSLYRIFISVMIVQEAISFYRKLPKFRKGDVVFANENTYSRSTDLLSGIKKSNRLIIEDYLYDVEEDKIKFICVEICGDYGINRLDEMFSIDISDTVYTGRASLYTLDENSIRIDRDYMIDKIIKK